MKPYLRIAFVLALAGLGLLAGVQLALAQTFADAATKEVMKDKLQHSQAVLEGIATEDFARIQEHADKLGKLSQAAGWHARQTPEYVLFTTEFRRQTDALTAAAQEKNVDAATLAYVQMTFSCVHCHKYMRGKKVAAVEPVHLPL